MWDVVSTQRQPTPETVPMVVLGETQVANTFRWRTAKGHFLRVGYMDNNHLFNTVRMIWNNFMPEAAHVGIVKLYVFPSYYNRDYLIQAIRAMVPELLSRYHALSSEQRHQVGQMRSWFAKGIPFEHLKVTK